ncbi:hypothetical protein E2C01_034206 [Portunus trituberculatus]|uniref:Uncharacterized protein n=1 Tax=Portunus trituberculatus TaxID=210409 RepID=A0A5B7F6G4_PORTR|nr:hypothetical protein [Portunus trituberculatus]
MRGSNEQIDGRRYRETEGRCIPMTNCFLIVSFKLVVLRSLVFGRESRVSGARQGWKLGSDLLLARRWSDSPPDAKHSTPSVLGHISTLRFVYD